MSDCKWLSGKNIAPKTSAEAKALVGKEVVYIRNCDIDRHRGMAFKQHGKIAVVFGKNIAIDDEENFVLHLSGLVEMTLAEESEGMK